MKTRDAYAVEAIPYGSPVVISPPAEGETTPPCRICKPNELDMMGGVAKRPPQAGDKTRYEPGQKVTVQTDGHILCSIEPGNNVSIDLIRGRF